MRPIITICSIFIITVLTSLSVQADDKQDLKSLLDHFLANQTEAVHNSFWADDLIYTSSNGTRFGKQTIMDGFKSRKESDQAEESPSRYSAEDIQIKLYGSIAVIAFKLVAKNNGKISQTFWNTGTFQKRNDHWQAVAWQATKIPPQ